MFKSAHALDRLIAPFSIELSDNFSELKLYENDNKCSKNGTCVSFNEHEKNSMFLTCFSDVRISQMRWKQGILQLEMWKSCKFTRNMIDDVNAFQCDSVNSCGPGSLNYIN